MKFRIHHLTAFAIPLLLSCSFFEPRTPEDPNPGEDIPWLQPYAPSTVIVNLTNALQGLSVPIYMACCDSSFTSVADAADTTEFSGSWNFSNWDFDVEQNTMGNIFSAAMGSGMPDDSLLSVTITYVSEFPDPAAPSDSAEIWRDYEIVVAGSEYCGWDQPAQGRVMFLMVEDGYGLWSIKQWNDYRPEDYTGENLTWGVSKATYR